MEEQFDTAEKKVLVDIVKLVQKRGMQGTKGGWKEFLNSHDRKLGASLSDPSRRSNDVLASFLKTFTKEDDLKFFAKVMQCHSNRHVVQQLTKKSSDNEFLEQRLVRLTLEHPQYSLDYLFPSHDEEWVVTKLRKKSKLMKSNDMVAVDCEMVLCEDGTEALVRVCVVDRYLQVKLNEFVKPNKEVVDHRTEITGITAGDLDGVTCSLADIQKSMKKLLSDGTILVGHSLYNDLQALKIDHARVIDTSFIFKYSDGPIYRRPSLNNLCKSVLGYEVRKKGAPHNCLDDACAAMKLVLAKMERGVDTDIPLVPDDLPEIDMEKLLLHRIPISVRSKTLCKIIPGDFTIELKPSKKSQGEKYSALAIFKNPQEAHQAFENVVGNQEKDSFGRPQKLVTFPLNTGGIASLYVRKMAHDNPSSCILSKKGSIQVEKTGKMARDVPSSRILLKKGSIQVEETGKMAHVDPSSCILSKKRSIQVEETADASKKLKIDQMIEEEKMPDTKHCDQCANHLREIERLKQELRNKDFQISTLDKIIINYNTKEKKGTRNIPLGKR